MLDKDVDLESAWLKVRRGKGGKGRVLWLGEQTLKLLNGWLDRRQVGSELIFTTLDGEAVNPRYLRAMVKRYGQKAGIEKDVHPHTLGIHSQLTFTGRTGICGWFRKLWATRF